MISIVLVKIIGVFLLIAGLASMIHRRGCLGVMSDLVKDRPLFYVVTSLELLAGLLVVSLHNVWVGGTNVIVSIIGWAMVIEGASYMLLPYSMSSKIVNSFNKQSWYVGGGLVAVVLGIYLLSSI